MKCENDKAIVLRSYSLAPAINEGKSLLRGILLDEVIDEDRWATGLTCSFRSAFSPFDASQRFAIYKICLSSFCLQRISKMDRRSPETSIGHLSLLELITAGKEKKEEERQRFHVHWKTDTVR